MASCPAGQRYCPPWELTPWQMTTTARGRPIGGKLRTKISTSFVLRTFSPIGWPACHG